MSPRTQTITIESDLMGFPHTPGAGPGERQDETSAVVERLRAELERARDTARTVAIIERAKGALAERLGCGIDAAYTHLLQLARDSGIAPVDAAALLFPSSAWDDASPPRPRVPVAEPAGAPEPVRTASAGAAEPARAAAPPAAAPAHGRALPPAVQRSAPASPARPLTSDIPAAQFAHAQRMGELGYGVWDLTTGLSHWSDQVYTIFGRSPADGPFPLDRLTDLVVPEDVPIAGHLVGTLLDGRERVDNEIRIQRGEETRELRLVGESVLDPHGRPVAVRCLYQDVTGWRRGERALSAGHTQLERLREDDERNQAIEMQHSILPLPEGIVDKPGLRAAVRYLPAGCLSRVGGDWYETTTIEGDGVFLAIGDVSGHGRRAAAAMARLRNGLSGLAFTGAPPDRLLGWLNRLTLHWPDSLTATVFAGRFDPDTRTLTWAQGGHFPPLLIRDGHAAALDPPEGVLLGAVPDPSFGVRTTALRSGDLLLLYTDGLVERRDRDLQAGLDQLARVASSIGSRDPNVVVDRVLAAFNAPNPNDDTCVVAIEIV